MKTTRKYMWLLLLLYGILSLYPLMTLAQYKEKTFTVDSIRKHYDWVIHVDEFTIVSTTGINWLRISANTGGDWERSNSPLYDDVPVAGAKVICPKISPDPYGPVDNYGIWTTVQGLSIFLWGHGSITIRVKELPYGGPYVATDHTKFTDEWMNEYGEIAADPPSAGPGDNVRFTITIPSKFSKHIDGVDIKLPEPTAKYEDMAKRRVVHIPYNPSGKYTFLWTVPDNDYYKNLRSTQDVKVSFTAKANKPDEKGNFRILGNGNMKLKISGELTIGFSVQDKKIEGNNTVWDNHKDRSVRAQIIGGKGPFKTKWWINGKEITNVPLAGEYTRKRTYANTTVLKDAHAVTFEVIDGNGNTAIRTISVDPDTAMSFKFYVNGIEVPVGKAFEWDKQKGLMILARIKGGKHPYKVKWIINDGEFVLEPEKQLYSNIAQLKNKVILSKAKKIGVEIVDDNGIGKRGTVYVGNTPGDEKEDEPTGPVGPKPTPPPLAGDTGKGIPPWVDWSKPWQDDWVQRCTREYLQKIVLPMANEYRKWENTGKSDFKKQPLFTRIDDWGRIFSPNMSATMGVDGNWQNPTHFVWSEYNKKPYAEERFGRTVEYYVKHECSIPWPQVNDLDAAINELAKEGSGDPCQKDSIKNEWSIMNRGLSESKKYYLDFMQYYDKIQKEINDQNSNPSKNDMIAYSLVSANDQIDLHENNMEEIKATGSSLISRAGQCPDAIKLFDVIKMLSEAERRQTDMKEKMDEVTTLLEAYGVDIEETMQQGNRFAQQNADPNWVQDGGLGVELMGDGIDNIADGLQDEIAGALARGNIVIILLDGGKSKDDIFGFYVDGRNEGDTPEGGRRTYSLNLTPGMHQAVVRGKKTDEGPCTYAIIIMEGMNELVKIDGNLNINQEVTYSFTVSGI